MTKKEKGLIIDSLKDLFLARWFDSPTKAIDGFRKILEAVRRRRIYWLIQSMGLDNKNPSEKYKEEFLNFIENERGQEQLEEFIDASLKTSSKTGIVAMGLLFSDLEHGNYDEDFRRLSCKALQGITEDLINSFLPLCKLEPVGANGMTWMADTTTAKATESVEPDSPYKVVQLNASIIDKNQTLKDAVKSSEDAFASINELIRRGMFLPDHATSRIGSNKGWSLYFGVTDFSLMLQDLLLKAKNISGQLKNEQPMESQEDD